MRKSFNGAQLRYGGLILVGAGLLALGIVTAILLIDRHGKEFSTSAAQDISAVPADVNFKAPDLRLKNLDGDDASIEDYQGKVVLINNWATWCPPCREEMPGLEAFFKAHQDEGFILIGIDAGDSHDDVADFINSFDLSFPVWLDPTNQALQAFRNYGLPNSYVIDRDGYVRLVWTGAISEPMLEKYVTPLLEE
jgi:thiol-disulfide isomerase/thioredoxin